jgi:hypothetical protein
MLLADIRHYLKQRGIASLDEVAIHFDIATDSASFALNYWINKGKVTELGANCSSSCKGCNSNESHYQWKEISAVPIQWLQKINTS